MGPKPRVRSPGQPLHELRVREKTLVRYRTVLMGFVIFLMQHQWDPMTSDDLDDALTLYGDSMLVGRGEYGTLLSAVRFFLPRVKRDLDLSSATLSGWQAVQPISHTTPMMWVFVLAIGRALGLLGLCVLASALIVQFEAYLRPSEILGLTKDRVFLPEFCPAFLGGGCFIVLGEPEVGTKVNRQQFVQLRRPLAIAALRALFYLAAPGGRLVPYTYSQYSRGLKDAIVRLNLSHLNFSVGSPRPGSATQDILDGKLFSYAQNRGRWKHEKTCCIYLDVASALALQTTSAAQPFFHLVHNPVLPPGILRF